MKRSNKVSEMINSFSPEALTFEQMDRFYCDDTMEYRTGDKYSSPIENIYDICTSGSDEAILLLGHKGCGKSTELKKLSLRLMEEGYPVKTVVCSTDLDLLNLVNSDLLILMGETLLEIADEYNCEIRPYILQRMSEFWIDVQELTTVTEDVQGNVETGVSLSSPSIIKGLLKIFANIKTNLKFNEQTRIEYRDKIKNRSGEWISLLSQISDEIRKCNESKSPIIIFEDLDKLSPEDAWKVFYNYAALLSGVKFPVIYTFPIGLSYDTRFPALQGYFTTETLPMIKIEQIDGTPYDNGINIIKEIVEKRTNLALFEEDVLERLIRFTGGSLRDLFYVINASAKRATRRKSEKIAMEDANRALEELKTSLTRRIELKNYEFLSKIYKGNKELIEDKEVLLKMLQASVVLEYNGKRWHNVHPLIVEFLKDQGVI